MPFGVVGLTHPKIAQGLDYWRLLVPLLHGASLGYPWKLTRLGNDLPTFGGEPPRVLILAETFAATHGSERRTLALCRHYRMLYTLDIADDPTRYERTEDSPMIREGGLWEAKLEVIREADLVTCPTHAMREILLEHNRHVEVLPDLGEAAHWGDRRPKDRPDALTIGVRGGATHARDWAILERPWMTLAEMYPDLHFVSAGLEVEWMKKLPSERYHHLGWQLIDRYQESLRWIDIGCAPLTDAAFNRSKSPIAWIDFSLAGAATVASATVYGDTILNGVNGLIASSEDDWSYQLGRLVGDPELRRRMARAAHEDVVRSYCVNAEWCAHRQQVYETHYRRVYGSLVPERLRVLN